MTVLTVRVKPNAKHAKVTRLEDGGWLIHLKAPPLAGKANGELIVLLAKEFGVAKAQVRIRSGQTARIKRVEIDD